MSIKVSDLTSYLRTMLMDIDEGSLQEFTDEQLTNKYLVMGIKVENAILGDLGCNIQRDITNSYWEFVTDPEDWLQIFYCVATCLRMRSWEQVYSFDNGVTKTTNHNIKDVVNGLKDTYNAILQERRYGCVGYSYNTWDDYFTRFNLIYNEISKGYR